METTDSFGELEFGDGFFRVLERETEEIRVCLVGVKDERFGGFSIFFMVLDDIGI